MSSIKYKLPDVQIIGAQKAGTTSIAAWLNEKGACPATVFSGELKYHQKEVHYFDLHSRYRKGIEFYAEHFKDCTHGFRMDATPATFDHSKRVSDAYKQAGGEQHEKLKIIYIVREPVAREFSWYKHMVENYYRDGRDRFHEVTSNDSTVISFDEYVVEYLMPRLKKRQHLDSYYADTLRKWTSVFDRKQILVLSFDEILDQPEQVEKRICQHIGMCNKASSEGIPHANQKRVAGLRAVSCSVKDQLDIMFDATNNELYNFLDDNSRPHNDNEQHPFPKFQSGTCVPDFAESDSADFENGSR